MNGFDFSEIVLERRFDRFRQNRHAVFSTFAFPNRDPVAGKVSS